MMARQFIPFCFGIGLDSGVRIFPKKHGSRSRRALSRSRSGNLNFRRAPPAPPEPMPKESVEELLRRLVNEDLPEHLNARYVLAILLERKRILKQVDIRESAEEKILIYEHVKTGEVFIIPDPRLRLDQLDSVQQEIYSLLAQQEVSELSVISERWSFGSACEILSSIRWDSECVPSLTDN